MHFGPEDDAGVSSLYPAPTTPTAAGVSVEALKRAMDSAAIPQELRAPLIGFYCNELNAAPLPVGELQGVSDETFEELWTLFSQHMANFNANRDNTETRAKIDKVIAARRPVAVGVSADSGGLRDVVAQVCEGWTLPEVARKMLETALWATPPSATFGPLVAAPQAAVDAAAICEAEGARWRKEAQKHLPHYNSVHARHDIERAQICETLARKIREAATKAGGAS
jgi:hypothetical protein